MFGSIFAFFAGLLAVGAAGGGGSGGGSGSGGADPGTETRGRATRDEGSRDPVEPVTEDPDEPVPEDPDEGGIAAPAPGPIVEETPGGSAPTPPEADETVYIPEVAESLYEAGWEGLSNEEQLLLELVNAARLDPAGEAAVQGVGLAPGVSAAAKHVLAVDASLSAASDSHSEDMEANNYFSHTGLDGSTPTGRAALAGYTGAVGENLGWIGSTANSIDDAERVADHHSFLWGSPSHQANLMNGKWDVVGIGYVEGDYTYKGVDYRSASFVTQKFGSQPESHLTGVVIDDLDGDQFYDIGEGQGQVKVTAFNEGGVFTTETYASGGYSLALDPGTYSVVFHGGALEGLYETEVTIGAQNVKLDVIEDTDAIVADLVTTETAAEAITNNLTLAYEASEDLYLGELLDEAIHSAEDAAMTMEQAPATPGAPDSPDLSLILTDPVETSLYDSSEAYRDEESDDDILVA